MTTFSAHGISVDLPHDGSTARILDAVSFDLHGGDICDLTGPSGCGKSTLLRACARMMPMASGELSLDGRPAEEFPGTEWRRRVCLVPQKPSLVGETVRDNLLLPWMLGVRKGETAPSSARMRSIADAALLDDVDLDRPVSRLSGGQAARVALLRAFLAKPDVLLMDEVDAALDPEASAAVSALTKEAAAAGTACLRIRHRASDGLATCIFAMHDASIEEIPAESRIGCTGRKEPA